MRTVRMIGLSAVVIGAMFSGSSAGAAPPVTLKCGQTVTTSVKLGNDLLNCPVDGIVVGASNITIDLNGHRITGPPNFDPEVCSCGVNDNGGFHNVTLRSGRIEGFRQGGSFERAEAVTVRNLVTSGQRIIPNNFHDGNGIFLYEAPGSRVSGSTFSDAFRGIGVGESSNVLVQNVHIAKIEHAGVAFIDVTDSTVRHANIDSGGDLSIEVWNSSRNLIEDNRISGFEFTAIRVFGENGAPGVPGEKALGNRIEGNVMHDASIAESSGIEVVEVDGGTVRETTVANNTIRSATEDGIVVYDVISANGQGDPPYEFPIGVGPSQNLLEGNVVNGNGVSENGIFLTAPRNVVTRNRANRNTKWGIYAIEGTIDGGGNTAHHNGQPAQCSGVVCNGVTAASPLQRTARPGFHRFRGVGRDWSLRR